MTKTEISNLALSHAREQLLSGNVETTTELIAETVLLHYDQTLKQTLGRVRPSFAQKRATLTLNATAPDFGWDNAYVLPTDYVELVRFNGDDEEPINNSLFEIEGRNLLTDEGEAFILYTRFEEDSSLYDAEFIEAFALLLAAKIINARRGDRERAEALTVQGELMASESSAKSAQARRRFNSRDKILRSSRWTGVKRRISTNDSLTGDSAVIYDN